MAKMLARSLLPTSFGPGKDHIIFTALISTVTPINLAPPIPCSHSCLSHWELLNMQLDSTEDLPSCFNTELKSTFFFSLVNQSYGNFVILEVGGELRLALA